MNDLLSHLRTDFEDAVADASVPPGTELARASAERGRRIRTRRRAAVAALAAACVAVVLLPSSLRAGDGAGTVDPPPATSSPSAAAPTPTASAKPPAPHRTWRVTERCHPSMRNVCGRFAVVSIEVDGVEYRNMFGGETPLNPPNRSIQMRVGDGKDDARVLGGVVSRSGTTVSYRLYVDGRLVRHYPDGRVRLLPVPSGRHEVRLVADASVAGGRTSIAVADFRAVPSRQ